MPTILFLILNKGFPQNSKETTLLDLRALSAQNHEGVWPPAEPRPNFVRIKFGLLPILVLSNIGKTGVVTLS